MKCLIQPNLFLQFVDKSSVTGRGVYKER